GGDDVLSGDIGEDLLVGGDGNDVLDGGDDADFLSGDAGDDVLTGGDGDDTLAGGLGDDVLTGGDGLDLFIYNDGDGQDHITDRGSNTLRFGFGFFGSGLVLELGSLKLDFTNLGDIVHLDGFDPNDPYGSVVIDRFEFTDTVLSYTDLLALGFDINGTPDVD